MADIFTNLGSIFTAVMGQVSSVVQTIIGTPLFLAPVILCLGAGMATIAIKVVRKLGLNGLGRRKRRRRAR